jgi:hypothetical protein
MPDSPWQPVDDWTLLVGSQVAVHDRDRIVDTGTVEVVTGDGAILWLQQEGVALRRVVEKVPGRNLRVVDLVTQPAARQPHESLYSTPTTATP